jgi:hypothetical protein
MEIALLAVLAIVAVEVFLSGTLSSFYFTVGIPIFRRESVSPRTANAPPSTKRLEVSFGRGAYAGMIFRRLNDSQYAFRELMWDGFFRFHYTPMMHGLMTFDRDNGKVRVVGMANWFPIAFIALFVFSLRDFEPSEAAGFGAFLCGLVAFIYAIQARRFSQIAATAAALWCGEAQPLTVRGPPGERFFTWPWTLWRALVISAIGIWLAVMALMVIGIFTEEWTCHEKGGDWKCVGGKQCEAEATKRFDTFRRTVSCERTDWPMVPIQKAIDFLFRNGT